MCSERYSASTAKQLCCKRLRQRSICGVPLVAVITRRSWEDMKLDIGFLHRGFEKSCENVTWAQIFPYTDRLNYVSSIMNNVGFALAVEKLCTIDVPPRAK